MTTLENIKKTTIFGTPITPRRHLDELHGEAFCLSYWNRSDLNIDKYVEIAGELLLDNGAFSAWQKGVEMDDGYWDGYYAWANKILARHPHAWAIIPDTITGTVEENDRLRRESWLPSDREIAVWHMHEPLGYLEHLVSGYHRIAVGSSGEFAKVGTAAWHARIDEAFGAVRRGHESQGDTRQARSLHILRAQSMHHRYDFDSSDSTNLAANHCRYKAEGAGHVRRFADRIKLKVAA